jgi:CheY-like chemotaxis protein
MHPEDEQKNNSLPNPITDSPLTVAVHSSVTPCVENKPCVLVVEDNRLNSELVKIFLKDLCGMDFARTGEDAVGMARLKKYNAIIMDINLGPGMNGVQATKVIRTFDGFANTPIIAVTGYAMESEKELILESGCSHFVSKPIEKNSFTELMREILEAGQ